MTLRCIAIDDEYLAIKVIQEYASRMPGLVIERTFTDSTTAQAYLRNHAVDLLFLDVQMPYLNGFDLLQSLHNPPAVIFVTARHDYAVQAFSLDVLDYLVKPFAFERFLKAVNKAHEYIELQKSRSQGVEWRKFITVKSGYEVHRIVTDSIIYIEGLSEYVKIFTTGKVIIALAALKDLEKELPQDNFIRVHKSFIVNLEQIASFSTSSLQLRNKAEVPIGRVYKDNCMAKLRTGRP